MPGTIVVVVVLAAGEAHCTPADRAVMVMRGALPSGEQLLVREVESALDDKELAVLRTSTGARAVIEIAWSHPLHDAVHLHVAAGPTADFADRDLSFGEADAEPERGRTVGLVLTSMVQGSSPPPATTVPPSGPPPSAVPPARGAGVALDLGGQGMVGLDARGSAFGVRLGAALTFGAFLLRGSATFSIGRFSSAGADTTWARFAIGGAGTLTDAGSFRTALGLDLGVGREWVERGTEPVSRARWVADLTPYLHLGWAVQPRLYVALELGPTMMVPRTRVRIGDADAGTLPVLGGSIGLGVRLYL